MKENQAASPFDIECLATAYELDMTLVTDDLDLRELAVIYTYPVLSTLKLLRKLLSPEIINIKEICDCIYMWQYFNDTHSPWNRRMETDIPGKREPRFRLCGDLL